ncbi:MAG: hypothetical protein JJU34_00725 [Lunatimonas sp.]|uniref:hypothetical protein n=1 Tax=Lunatimonas sp. TaxID=2060141 RepID=UPI00263AE27B|nr:hypothetical protein [Lunatimonas sp.]MCC5935778.1 hypothetical protein [Lunatimonas sp.]
MRSLFLAERYLPRPAFRHLPYPHYHLTLSEMVHVHGLTVENLASYRIIQVDWNDLDQPVYHFKLEELSSDMAK